MSNSFDGAGKESSDDPSFRAPLIMLLVLVVLIVGLLLAASGALNGNGADGIDTQVNPPLLETGGSS